MNVLIKAYMNDTLQHQNCQACAVGNLVADALEIKLEKMAMISGKYSHVVAARTVFSYGTEWFNSPSSPAAKEELARTGYTRIEIDRIENAFETAFYQSGRANDPKVDIFDNDMMFQGLCNVMDVLADIHGVDFSTKTEFKSQLEAVHEAR